MTATLQQLLTVNTPPQNAQFMVAKLAGIGFPNTTNWTTGTVPLTLLQTIGFPLTDIQSTRFKYAAASLLDYAAIPEDQGGPGRDWLELHADQVFNNQAFPAVATEIDETFTDAANQGPFTIGPGGAGVAVGQGQPIYRTTNSANVVLPLGGSVVIRVRAPSPGTAFNVPDGALTFFAAGRLPGVTVSNIGPGSIKVAGTDAEANSALVQRCRTKWALLSTGSPVPAYINWALYAGQGQVGKVKPRVNLFLNDPGRVDLYLASPAGGGVAPAVVDRVQEFIAPLPVAAERTGARIPETAKCVVSSANSKTIFINGTILVYPEFNNSTFKAQIASDIAAYQGAFPIGGVLDNPPTMFGHVPYTRVLQLLLNRSGVALEPAQEALSNLTISPDNVLFFKINLLLDPIDSVTFDISGLQLASVTRPT